MEGVFSCYENFFEKVCKNMTHNGSAGDLKKQIIETQYQILFRRWDELYGQWKNMDNTSLLQLLQQKAMQPVMDDGITTAQSDKIEWKQVRLINRNEIKTDDLRLIDLLRWNSGYFKKAFSEKKREHILEFIDRELGLGSKSEISYYTDCVYGMDKNPNVLELFFCGEQPLLDVQHYERQERASKMLRGQNCNYHLLFDEVGTGKTVSALYCMRDVIDRKKNDAKILIVCPNNKVGEWKSDIQRQMGLYAHFVTKAGKVKSEEEKAWEKEYEGSIKSCYFKEKEPLLFIERQQKKQMNAGCNKWEGNKKWDLIVIDEGHLCFQNYDALRAEKAVLLTATPIIVHASKDVRTLGDYEKKLSLITTGSEFLRNAPLENLFAESDIFTQNFREDLGIEPKNRKIIFLECERWEGRKDCLDILENIWGSLARLQCEQDDELLIEEVYVKYCQKIEEEGYLLGKKPNVKNHKYETLSKYLRDNKQKSYILFFTRRWTADLIYKKLTEGQGIEKNDLIVAIKYGKRLDMYPEADRELKNNMLDYMQVRIREGKRVLFLTTGGTGGTGLNLGQFHGVINYELPFTCIELEQRFGRVDRMDVAQKEKELVFILNNDSNHMLRYSTMKIVETCKYLPVRNTILFYPEVVKKNLDTLKADLDKICCSEEELGIWNELQEKRRKVEEAGHKVWLSDVLREWKKNKLSNILGARKKNKDLEKLLYEFDLPQNDFINYLKDKNEELCGISRKLNSLERLKRDTKKWCGMLGVKEGIIQKTDEDEILFAQSPVEESDESEELDGKKGEDGLELESYKSENGITSIHPNGAKKQNADIFDLNRENIEQAFLRLKQSIQELEEQSLTEGEIATGLYYVKEGNYVRQTVKDFRENIQKKSVQH